MGSDLEFGGTLGAPFMILGLPFAVYAINSACSPESCSVLKFPAFPSRVSAYLDSQAAVLFLFWFFFHALIAVLPLGPVYEGLPLCTGKRLKYRCNAFLSLILSVGGFGVAAWLGYPVSVLHDKFFQLITTAMIFSFSLSVLLYLKSHTVTSEELAQGGNSGNVLYDFFIGRELNPRLGPLDLKFFCELRPGLIGWVILDLSFVMKAYESGGVVPPALALVTVFHTWYVADALWFEEAILTTMDIVHDGFGLMLVFGDLVWVPFLYTLQARFLLEHPQDWPIAWLVVIAVLHVGGYCIFRGANSQKNNFRKNPNDPSLSGLETLSTTTGKKLLVSGWWGLCRHPNYLGDLIMATSWSLPSGFSHLLPYFYPIYFLILLIHRSVRDDHSCRKKYGHDWQEYCKRVPYVIFPYLY